MNIKHVFSPSIYIASKTKHAPKWIELRSQGYDIISTWIDEYQAGASKDLSDLASRCISEAMQAEITIVYHEEGEILKGALIEMGAALAAGKIIVIVGMPLKENSAFMNHRDVFTMPSFEEAVERYVRGNYYTYQQTM